MKRNLSSGERGSRPGWEPGQSSGGVALVAVAALVVTALPDIVRYIKISRM